MAHIAAASAEFWGSVLVESFWITPCTHKYSELQQCCVKGRCNCNLGKEVSEELHDLAIVFEWPEDGLLLLPYLHDWLPLLKYIMSRNIA